MKTFRKFIWISFLIPFSLYSGWGDADRLRDGSCGFDKETGYDGIKLYTKGKEAFAIVETTDVRYGTTSTVYNAITCEKITSGSKKKSNFDRLLKKKGFVQVDLTKGKSLDKSFSNQIDYNQDSDIAKVKVAKIDSNIKKELLNILRSLSTKSTKLYIDNTTRQLIKTNEFKRAFLSKIYNISDSRFNYKYALKLNKSLGNDRNIKYNILKKYLFYKVQRVSQLPRWAKSMYRLGESNYIQVLKFDIMKIRDFGDNLTINNFLSSNEYKYALRYITPKVSKILDTNIYGLKLNYGNKIIKLKQTANCNKTGDTQKSGVCGFFWSQRCTWYYTHYSCKAHNIYQLSKIERKLTGRSRIVNALSSGWSYKYLKERVVHHSSSSLSGTSSSSCKQRLNTCYRQCNIQRDNNGGLLTSSDRDKCRSYCQLGEFDCEKGNRRKADIYFCYAKCYGVSEKGLFSKHDSCMNDCEYRLSH